MTDCHCPGCGREAVYREPAADPEVDHFTVCRKHVDPTTDGIERVTTAETSEAHA